MNAFSDHCTWAESEKVASPLTPDSQFHVSFFKDRAATAIRRTDMTLEELKDLILSTSAKTKADLPWLKLAIFGNKKSDRGTIRHDKNTKNISGMELDYDGGEMSFEDACVKLDEMKIKALIYTSPSHMKSNPRWRILAPTSQPSANDLRAKLVARVNGYFDRILGKHRESFTLSQAYYFGLALDNSDPDHQCAVFDGDDYQFIDLRNDLYKYQAKGEVREEPQDDDARNPFEAAAGEQKRQSGRGFENILAGLGDGPGLEGFNGPLCAATASYAVVHGIEFDREELKTLLREAINKAPKRPGRPKADIRRYLGDEYLDNAIETAIKKFGGKGLGPVVSDRDHMSRARRFREVDHPQLQHYRDDFMDFDAGAYRIIDDGSINTDVWTFLDKARASRTASRSKDAKPEIVPFQPDKNSVSETMAALKAVVHLNPELDAPCWLNGRDDLAPDALIAFPNGLLDLRDDKFHPVDKKFFTTAALGFDYVASAPEPVKWKKFLAQIFEGEDQDEQIAGLQEMFGYMLTDDVSQEKAFLLLGPRRSGKGTMLAVLRKLLSKSSVIGPSLKSLGTNFGLQSMIAKQLAIIDDLRVGAPKDQDVLIENVLKITGRGLFTIDRKYKAHWTGTLLVKLLLVSNLLPKLGDDSAALASRFISFTTRVSFYGRENPTLLENELAPELAGIFHWALEGLRRLRKRGYLLETNESENTRERLANLGSPARAFLAECCELDLKAHTEKDDLYRAWCDYQESNNTHPGSKEKFFAALYAAGGGMIKDGRPRDKVTHKQIYAVIGLRLLEVPNQFTEEARSDYFAHKGRKR